MVFDFIAEIVRMASEPKPPPAPEPPSVRIEGRKIVVE
jgi:hypothetical protein